MVTVAIIEGLSTSGGMAMAMVVFDRFSDGSLD